MDERAEEAALVVVVAQETPRAKEALVAPVDEAPRGGRGHRATRATPAIRAEKVCLRPGRWR